MFLTRHAPLALGLLLVGVLPGCESAPEEEGASQGNAISAPSESAMVSLGDDYRFCLAPVDASAEDRAAIHDAFVRMPLPNLESVRTLGHLADLAYRSPVESGPELERLGFGKPGDGALVADCGRDAEALRRAGAKARVDDPNLTRCARDWRTKNPGRSAADFLEWADGKSHAERDIEFFSAGYRVEADGRYVQGSSQLLWARHRTEPWVVVAFRGTEFPDAGDMWTDADFPTVPFLNGAVKGWGQVHGGFERAYRSVSRLLDERLAALEPGTHIWVTGHSLGGALASIFAAELLARMERGVDLRFDGLVTFGSPRVGDTTFFERAESVATKRRVALHRVQNVSGGYLGYDPIVHVPFRSTFGEDFGHVGAPIEVFDDGRLEYALRPSRAVLPAGLVEDAIAAFKEKVVSGLSSAFPHFLDHYNARIDSAIASGMYDDLLGCGPRKSMSKRK